MEHTVVEWNLNEEQVEDREYHIYILGTGLQKTRTYANMSINQLIIGRLTCYGVRDASDKSTATGSRSIGCFHERDFELVIRFGRIMNKVIHR